MIDCRKPTSYSQHRVRVSSSRSSSPTSATRNPRRSFWTTKASLARRFRASRSGLSPIAYRCSSGSSRNFSPGRSAPWKKKARPGTYELVFTGTDADGKARTTALALTIR